MILKSLMVSSIQENYWIIKINYNKKVYKNIIKINNWSNKIILTNLFNQYKMVSIYKLTIYKINKFKIIMYNNLIYKLWIKYNIKKNKKILHICINKIYPVHKNLFRTLKFKVISSNLKINFKKTQLKLKYLTTIFS
jgi:hypothetical protein